MEVLAKKFLNGLLSNISRSVATVDLSTVSQISEATRRMEYHDAKHPSEPKRMKTEVFSGGHQS